MTLLLLTLTFFLLAAAGLSIGIMLGRSGIRGSCRAMADAGGDDHCACTEPCPRRRRELARAAGRAEETLP